MSIKERIVNTLICPWNLSTFHPLSGNFYMDIFFSALSWKLFSMICTSCWSLSSNSQCFLLNILTGFSSPYSLVMHTTNMHTLSALHQPTKFWHLSLQPAGFLRCSILFWSWIRAYLLHANRLHGPHQALWFCNDLISGSVTSRSGCVIHEGTN